MLWERGKKKMEHGRVRRMGMGWVGGDFIQDLALLQFRHSLRPEGLPQATLR